MQGRKIVERRTNIGEMTQCGMLGPLLLPFHQQASCRDIYIYIFFLIESKKFDSQFASRHMLKMY